MAGNSLISPPKVFSKFEFSTSYSYQWSDSVHISKLWCPNLFAMKQVPTFAEGIFGRNDVEVPQESICAPNICK